jgi:uncharacterized protein (TIGR02391 family)
MNRDSRFFFKICRSGHLVWAKGSEVADLSCSGCGQEFIDTCKACGYKIDNSFVTRESLLDKKPLNFPRTPEFCARCGAPYPWTKQKQETFEATGIWSLMNQEIVELAKPRFLAGHYADAVEAALKEINVRVKQRYKTATGDELDGVPLMRKAFTPSAPIIVLDDLSTETVRNVQQGYMELFAGSMAGIRNPKAHSNVIISPESAIHHLMLASLLLSKLAEVR